MLPKLLGTATCSHLPGFVLLCQGWKWDCTFPTGGQVMWSYCSLGFLIQEKANLQCPPKPYSIMTTYNCPMDLILLCVSLLLRVLYTVSPVSSTVYKETLFPLIIDNKIVTYWVQPNLMPMWLTTIWVAFLYLCCYCHREKASMALAFLTLWIRLKTISNQAAITTFHKQSGM